MSIHTAKRLTQTITGAYLKYAPFDPAGWHRVRIELNASDTLKARMLTTQNDTVTMRCFDWAASYGLDFHYDYAYELDDGEYKSFLEMLFRPEDGDKAMLFKLTFGGNL